jgi:hypothetical protein
VVGGGRHAVKKKKKVSRVSLPTKVSRPSSRLADYSTLLFGEKKIGKTSLAAQFPNSFFMMFEPGARALKIKQRPVTKWADAIGYLRLLQKDKEYDTVVVDTADLAFKLCQRYTVNKLGVEHPSDEEWGKGWEALRDRFTTWVMELLTLQKGVIFISHATEKEIKKRSGYKYHKTVPTMAGQASDILEGVIDIWAYYHYEGKKRVLTVQGDEHTGAGHRIEGHFQGYTDIPMGKSAQEAYANFMKAWNNERIITVKKKRRTRG